MHTPTPAELDALWEALLSALSVPASEQTRRTLIGAVRQLARELDRECPLPTREERRMGYTDGKEERG
jgi:hypothetical protein